MKPGGSRGSFGWPQGGQIGLKLEFWRSQGGQIGLKLEFWRPRGSPGEAPGGLTYSK